MPLNELTKARYNTVIKANNLIQKSRFSLSTQQQKIVLYIISQIQKSDEEFKIYNFNIIDFCKVCGIDPKGEMYNLLKRQIKEIADKSIWIENESGVETLIRWIEKPYIDKQCGIIQIKIDEDMKPYLIQLKEKYTEYELIYTLNFKSKYSIRLYEYLKSIHYNKLKSYNQQISIDKLQQILDSNYKNFKDFHTRVIKKAQKEINTYSDIIFDYEIKYNRKKAIGINIIIHTKELQDRLKAATNTEKNFDERTTKSK